MCSVRQQIKDFRPFRVAHRQVGIEVFIYVYNNDVAGFGSGIDLKLKTSAIVELLGSLSGVSSAHMTQNCYIVIKGQRS